STVSRATCWCARATSPTTSPSATCSPPRSPAPTATRWARTTTRSSARRSCSSTTATPASSSAARPTRTSSASTCSPAAVGNGVEGWGRGPVPLGPMSSGPVRIGLLGCGNVGAALVSLVRERSTEIAARHGVTLEITRVAVHNLSRERAVEFADGVLTHDAESVVTDPDIDLVVETIGGIEPARHLILDALRAGKPVISANKELLANLGAELFAAAGEAGVDLL